MRLKLRERGIRFMRSKLAICSRYIMIICAVLVVLHCCSFVSFTETERGIISILAVIAAVVNYKSNSKK